MPEIQSVDPTVSRTKFDREIARYRDREAHHHGRGCFLIDASFPKALVLFASRKVKPTVLVAGAVLDFSNYDLRPPSVTFVDPFTRAPLLAKDLTISMLRRPQMPSMPPEMLQAMLQSGQVMLSNIIQFHGPEEPPFLCLPGVREYHDHPAHTGDSWLLHRGSGEGSLDFILNQIWKYGVDPFDQIQIQDVKVTLGGLGASFEAIPE